MKGIPKSRHWPALGICIFIQILHLGSRVNASELDKDRVSVVDVLQQTRCIVVLLVKFAFFQWVSVGDNKVEVCS